MTSPGKLVLVVIDAMAPAMLEQTIADGDAPALEFIRDHGTFVPECVAPFPSVTPVCAATITTGVGPDEHAIPAMNWYHRGESRYVEYGSSFTASRRHGVVRSLTDTVYRMNGEHLSSDVRTVFEQLDDDDVRTAGTTYLIYRGRYPHEPSDEGALARIVGSTPAFGHPVMGPRELFYADLYASRKTGCRATLGKPGVRDQHTGCVGVYMVEHDLYDFMLFSLPDNDAWSHRNGPAAQTASIAAADRQLMRLMDASGGPEAFLEQNAVIVCSDHAQVPIEASIPVIAGFSEFSVAAPMRLRDNVREEAREFDTAAARDWQGTVARWRDMPRASDGEIAVCPSMRSAQVYVLDASRREELLARVVETLSGMEGVDLTMWMDGDQAAIRDARGEELRFAPGAQIADLRHGSWDLDGSLSVLGGEIRDGALHTPEYPDALARVWSALHCVNGGDVLASAATGHEFLDWGGQHHIGGGSHGSLQAADSFASLLYAGLGESVQARGDKQELWALRDIKSVVCEHLGSGPGGGHRLARR